MLHRPVRSICLALAALPAGAAIAADAIGIYGGWGAFERDRSCHAMHLPEDEGDAPLDGAYLAIVVPRGGQPQAVVRLATPKAPTASASASVGGRRFALVGKGRELRAIDTRSDKALVAAIRSARALSVETLGTDGSAIVNGYDLRGAASAIDAARLACR